MAAMTSVRDRILIIIRGLDLVFKKNKNKKNCRHEPKRMDCKSRTLFCLNFFIIHKIGLVYNKDALRIICVNARRVKFVCTWRFVGKRTWYLVDAWDKTLSNRSAYLCRSMFYSDMAVRILMAKLFLNVLSTHRLYYWQYEDKWWWLD